MKKTIIALLLLAVAMPIASAQTVIQYRRPMKALSVEGGASLNQVKPVRVLDTPMKKQFFYALREE